jgi:hypothetical protein
MTTGSKSAIVLAVAAVCASDSLSRAQEPAVPADFELRINANCPSESFDTKSGVFLRLVSGGYEASAQVPMAPDTVRQLFRLVADAQLFEYPTVFVPPDWDGPLISPYTTYHIWVRAGGRTHTIQWGARAARTIEAKRLFAFVRAAYDVFRTDDRVKALPPPVPCE